MVSRTAVAILVVVALAAGVQSQFDGSTTGQAINKFVPLTVEITATGAANFVVTPATITRPTVLATPVGADLEFAALIAFTKATPFAFSAQVKEDFGSELASEDFIFNNQSLAFLERVTQPGATYTFVQALIYTPQETNPIPFVSPTGFLNADRSPFVAHIVTQNATLTAPNVAVRFDYQVTATGQRVSLFYSDRAATTATNGGTITQNLAQNYGFYINSKGQVFLGQEFTTGVPNAKYGVPANPTPTQSNTSSTPISSGRKLIEKLFLKA